MIQRKKRKQGGIPTASLSDISFLLLVFFLSTTDFDIKKGLGLMLPAPSSEDTKRVVLDKSNLAKVKINVDGQMTLEYHVNDVKQEDGVPSLVALETRIKKMVKANPDLVISLQTHRQSNYKNMVQALDHLRLAGAEKISLSTN